MALVVLLVEQPFFCSGEVAEVACRRKGSDRLGGDPGGQVGIDRPASVIANAVQQKSSSPLDRRQTALPCSEEAHHHKTGQWDRFQKTAAGRLHALEHFEAAANRSTAQPTRERIPRRPVVESGQTHRDQCRNRIADHRQSEKLVQSLRQAGQLKRQRRDLAPRHHAGQRAVGQNRHGKGFVFPVSTTQRAQRTLRIDIGMSAVKDVRMIGRDTV